MTRPEVDHEPLPGAVVDFPLRGEWCAINTPAHRVPSHGTDYFGQRYAYDFARLDPSGISFHRGSFLRHLTTGIHASEFFCWDEPVYSAFEGRVLAARDSWPDRGRVSLPWELLRGAFLASGPRGNDYRPLAGNFVLIEGAPGVALYAHLRCGSIRVRQGETVQTGEYLGSLGNSGNSTMPHLHFHVMDGPNPLAAIGLPCAFRAYERLEKDVWVGVRSGVPGRMERIRLER